MLQRCASGTCSREIALKTREIFLFGLPGMLTEIAPVARAQTPARMVRQTLSLETVDAIPSWSKLVAPANALHCARAVATACLARPQGHDDVLQRKSHMVIR